MSGTLTPKDVDFWHRHPYFDVPAAHKLDDQEQLVIVLGSDLILSVSTDYTDVIVFLHDTDGNCLNDGGIAHFRTLATAIACLDVVIASARALYPNHLLMAVDAK